MARKRDLKNEQFGRLKALEETEQRDSAGNVIWKCLCDCGNKKFVYVPSRNLISGNTQSCGCLTKENMRRISEKQIGKKILGVYYDKTYRKWKGYITINKKTYSLGSFKEKEEAIRIRKEAEKAKDSENFLEWYEKKILPNKRNKNGGFSYKRNKNGGFSYNKNRNNWQAYINVYNKRYYLGSYKKQEDAKKIRKEAEKAIETGNFLKWYKTIKKKDDEKWD